LQEAAEHVMREMFLQFVNNLNTILISDDPEVVHQARIGWRRFKSASRLFKPALVAGVIPSWSALQPLLSSLGELRDLDVACYETLPALADAYTAGDARRAVAWHEMTEGLLKSVNLPRMSVRYALQDPAVGSALLAITEWLEQLSKSKGLNEAGVQVSLRRWSRHRIIKLHRQLKIAYKESANPEGQHRIRILAKRLRYAIESLRTLLPKQWTKKLYLQATNLQQKLGAARDVKQAATLIEKLSTDRELAEFLRGVAVGRTRS
jgi:CHAD domain-containing protein